MSYDIEIIGKIDRIIIDPNKHFTIFDYKTGLPPSKKSVILGNEMQLTLSALLLVKKGFCSIEQITGLNYWHLSLKEEKNIHEIIDSKITVIDLLNNTQKNLEELFTKFFLDNKPFSANQNTKNSIYKNIARFEEWNN